MAISRKAPRQDIRNINLSAQSLTRNAPLEPTAPEKTKANPDVFYSPLGDLKLVAISTIPLIIALGIGAYLDTTKHWVIPLAEWFLKLGS